MSNPAYGTKDNPVPVLKMVGVHESIRDNDRRFMTKGILMGQFSIITNVIRLLEI